MVTLNHYILVLSLLFKIYNYIKYACSHTNEQMVV